MNMVVKFTEMSLITYVRKSLYTDWSEYSPPHQKPGPTR